MPIKPDLPSHPEFGEAMEPTHESAETLRLLALRRSTPVAALIEPGPSPADVDAMLRLATRVPDHRKLEPWRFIVFEGAARNALADIFAHAARARNPAITDVQLNSERALALRSPVVIAIASTPVHDDPKKTPVWEQELSSGAACQNLMIAAAAMGWAASWISEWPAYDANVIAALGLPAGARIAGFIHLGTAKEMPVERQRPDMANVVKRWPTG